MGSLQSELQKLITTTKKNGAVNTTTHETDDKKMKKRKTPNFQRTRPAAVRQLIDEYGGVKTADMLGISVGGLSTIVTKEDVSLSIERLAQMIVHNEGKVVKADPDRLLVCRVPHDEHDPITRIVKALGGRVMDMGNV